MDGRKARSVRRCLLQPLHRTARRKRQDAADVPCEGNVRCQDCSLTLYAGAKSPGVDRESNWLPAKWPVLALHSRLPGGEPHPRWSVQTAACQASTIGTQQRCVRRTDRDVRYWSLWGAKRTSGDVNKRNLWVHVGDQYKTAPA